MATVTGAMITTVSEFHRLPEILSKKKSKKPVRLAWSWATLYQRGFDAKYNIFPPTSLFSSLLPSLPHLSTLFPSSIPPPPLYPLQPIAQVIDSDEEVNKARNSINGGVETAGSKLLGYVKTWDE